MCFLCPKVFPEKALIHHIENDHCGRSVMVEYGFNFEEKPIQEDKDGTFQCLICPKPLILNINTKLTQEDMSEHFSLNHRKICVEQKWPVCIICEKPKWFYSKNECLKHYQTNHSEISSTKTNKQTLWFYYAKRHIGMELFERYNSEVIR